MDKQHFLSLFYLLGISPILYAFSAAISTENTFLLFGILNIVVLLLFTFLLSKASFQKKSIGLAVIGGLLLLVVVVGSLYNLGSNRLYNEALAPQTTSESGATTTSGEDALTINLSGDILSGQNLSGASTGVVLASGVVVSGDTTTLTPETDTKDQTTEDIKTTTESTYTTVLPSQGTLNYAQVIPYLVDTYNLKNASNKSFNFTNVSSSNILYKPFAIAASKAMIGENINPISKVSCNTYLVLKGIAAGWNVTYTGAPQAAYRAKAVELGKVNGCKDGAFVTKATL